MLCPFKYAGYSLLIRTITLETDDDGLFGSEVPLLSAAIELCHHTLAASALNAEQLRRENGLQVPYFLLRKQQHVDVALAAICFTGVNVLILEQIQLLIC